MRRVSGGQFAPEAELVLHRRGLHAFDTVCSSVCLMARWTATRCERSNCAIVVDGKEMALVLLSSVIYEESVGKCSIGCAVNDALLQ